MGDALPAWKQALIRARQEKDSEKGKHDEEAQARLAQLPAWKRELLLKKEAEQREQQQREQERAAQLQNTRLSSTILSKLQALGALEVAPGSSPSDSGAGMADTVRGITSNHDSAGARSSPAAQRRGSAIARKHEFAASALQQEAGLSSSPATNGAAGPGQEARSSVPQGRVAQMAAGLRDSQESELEAPRRKVSVQGFTFKAPRTVAGAETATNATDPQPATSEVVFRRGSSLQEVRAKFGEWWHKWGLGMHASCMHAWRAVKANSGTRGRGMGNARRGGQQSTCCP
jgi:hypothetical protein